MQSTTASPPKQPQPHICPDCGRAYKALETLTRHRKNHVASVRHACPRCPAFFKRKDLLDRHALTHNNEPSAGGLPSARTPRACDRCARLKARCDHGHPCMRCLRGGHACEQSQQRRRVPRASVSQKSSVVSGSSPTHEAWEEPNTAATAATPSQSSSPPWRDAGAENSSANVDDQSSTDHSELWSDPMLWSHDFDWGDAGSTSSQAEMSACDPSYADFQLESSAEDHHYDPSPEYAFNNVDLQELSELQWSYHLPQTGIAMDSSNEPGWPQSYLYNTQPWSARL